MNPEIRKKAAIWLVLVFVLGAATGGVFGYSFAHRSYAATKAAPMKDAERRAKKVAEMTQEIGLTAEQAQKAAGIIDNAQSEIRGIHEKSDSDVDAIRMKAREQMRAFLTPEQKPKFEEYVLRLDAERKRQKEAQMGK
jgi:Spy/CpxP family protein refolding chaperone